jgi:hypothetical protein
MNHDPTGESAARLEEELSDRLTDPPRVVARQEGVPPATVEDRILDLTQTILKSLTLFVEDVAAPEDDLAAIGPVPVYAGAETDIGCVACGRLQHERGPEALGVERERQPPADAARLGIGEGLFIDELGRDAPPGAIGLNEVVQVKPLGLGLEGPPVRPAPRGDDQGDVHPVRTAKLVDGLYDRARRQAGAAFLAVAGDRLIGCAPCIVTGPCGLSTCHTAIRVSLV